MNNIAAIQNFVNSNLNTPLNELISGGGSNIKLGDLVTKDINIKDEIVLDGNYHDFTIVSGKFVLYNMSLDIGDYVVQPNTSIGNCKTSVYLKDSANYKTAIFNNSGLSGISAASKTDTYYYKSKIDNICGLAYLHSIEFIPKSIGTLNFKSIKISGNQACTSSHNLLELYIDSLVHTSSGFKTNASQGGSNNSDAITILSNQIFNDLVISVNTSGTDTAYSEITGKIAYYPVLE